MRCRVLPWMAPIRWQCNKVVGEAIARARAGSGPTLVESKVYRLSAHGNIIAPPGVPLHYPEHEAITVFGKREEYEAALRGDPVPRFRGVLVRAACSRAAKADELPRRSRRKCKKRSRSPSRARSRSSSPRSTTTTPRLGGANHGTAALYRRHRCRHSSGDAARPAACCISARILATTENHEFVAAYGHDRVRVTPISETAEIGIAIGAAMAGLRPVVELYMAEFMLVAMDQVVNEAPRFRYMSGGQVKVPLVLKAGFGFTAGWAGQHTGSLTALFMGVPGLKVVVPSTAADAKGLMATAIRDDNPVVFLHHYLLTLEHGEVPDGEHLVPFGKAEIRRAGGDVTDRRDRLDGAARAGRGRETRRGGNPGRSDRSAHGGAAGSGDDSQVGRQDRPRRARRSGARATPR